MIFASILAIYIGSQIVALPVPVLLILLAAIFLFVWSLTAGNAWWVPVLATAHILGLFKVGVKVPPVMVGVGLAVLGLVPLVLVQNQKVLQRQRRPLPFVFYATALYVLLRLAIDIVPAEGQRNNMYRVVFEALWPFFFGFLFHHYGNLSSAKAAVGTVFIILILRCAASLVGYFFSIPIYIPGIDYVLSMNSADSLLGMRAVATSLLMVTLVIIHSTRSLMLRTLLLPMMLGACALVVMGEGRFATFLMLLLPVVFFAWSRKWLPLIVVFSCAMGVFLFVNVAPESLDSLNPSVGRAFSGLVIGGVKSEAQEANRASDEWHESMRKEGFRRWSLSPKTVLFGYGIRPAADYYGNLKAKNKPGEMVEQAANLGSFECALATMLSLFGLVGVALYTLVFIYFWRQVFPYFLRRPVGSFWEGLIFWACYSSISWYLVSYFQGGFPGVEIVLLIIAADVIQDGKLESRDVESSSSWARAPRSLRSGLPQRA